MTSTPEFDETLLETRDLALAALHEITPASTVGPAAGYHVEDDGVVSLRFENRLPGYPGWYWTVSVARVEGAEPTVLETELMPGDSALLAPDWVPWAERLAEYRAHQAELAEQAAAEEAARQAEGDDADAEDELDDADDDDDFDEDDVTPRLHAGDLDGVDIDELDESAADADETDADETDADETEAEDEPGAEASDEEDDSEEE